MDEVDINIVKTRCELAKTIEPPLLFAPVVIATPVIDYAFEISQICSEGPIGLRYFVWPTRCIEPPLKVEQRRVFDRNPEGLRRYAALFERSHCHRVPLSTCSSGSSLSLLSSIYSPRRPSHDLAVGDGIAAGRAKDTSKT
jgi:hypothetical protein